MRGSDIRPVVDLPLEQARSQTSKWSSRAVSSGGGNAGSRVHIAGPNPDERSGVAGGNAVGVPTEPGELEGDPALPGVVGRSMGWTIATARMTTLMASRPTGSCDLPRTDAGGCGARADRAAASHDARTLAGLLVLTSQSRVWLGPETPRPGQRLAMSQASRPRRRSRGRRRWSGPTRSAQVATVPASLSWHRATGRRHPRSMTLVDPVRTAAGARIGSGLQPTVGRSR